MSNERIEGALTGGNLQQGGSRSDLGESTSLTCLRLREFEMSGLIISYDGIPLSDTPKGALGMLC